MRLSEIKKLPTVLEPHEYRESSGVHESVLRGYQILQKVKYLLKEGASGKLVLELIEEMEDDK